jgi:uncharacterized membrane protein
MAGSFMRQGIWGLTLLAALGTGLAAGVFFAFSNFIMKALALVPADQAVSVMQSINITVVNPFFMIILFGSAAACGGLTLYAIRSLREPGAGWLIAGSLLYIVGSILVTAIFNVPLNDRLAAVHPGSAAETQQWTTYLRDWTAWNHVRAICSLLACAALVVALCRLSQTD